MPISVVDTPREGFLPDWVDPVHESDLIERRRAIHMTPEVGWCEFLSTARAAEVLSGLGFEVKVGREILQPDYVRGRDPEEAQHAELYAKDQGVPRQLLDRMGGLTGCVAVFDTKRPGKTVCIRAELDALYVSEPEDPEHLPARENFHSMRPGVMHACGHDGHQAVLLELGRFIAANKERLTGKIKFIFQPAEEGSRGAYAFVRSGVLDDVDTIICAHFGLDQPPGTVYTAPSKFLCTEKIDFEFIGRPSHAGMHPQTGRNALMAAANAAINLMALPRHGDGMTRVNVGNLHAGEGRNVVAAHATMQIEVRGANEKIKDYLAHEAVQRCAGMAMAFDVQMKHRVVGEAVDFTPDDSVSQLITVCAKRARYCRNIQPHLTVTYSDDAAVMFRRVQQRGGKAGYFIVGAMPTRDGKPVHTTENVDFDERYLTTLYDTYTNVIMALSGEW